MDGTTVNKRAVGVVGIAALCATLIAGCKFDEKEENGTCNFGGPSTACTPDPVHNRLNYSPNTSGRGAVLASNDDPVDLWVFKSKVSGQQNLYAQAQQGCAQVFLRECLFEPCDGTTLWHEAWQTIWYTSVCEEDGRKLIGNFNATADAHFMVGIGDWRDADPNPVNYTFTLEP